MLRLVSSNPSVQEPCPDCGVKVGKRHSLTCDVDVCPFCGGQQLFDGCIYAYFNIDYATLKEKHPYIYKHGLPLEMREEYARYLRPHRIPWQGVYPGVLECREYNLWCREVPRINGGLDLLPCEASDPGASEDLNRLLMCATWDKEKKRFVM